MHEHLRHHYQEYPYPYYPLFASVRPFDAYHISLTALWTYFNRILPPEDCRKILIAGCGTFAPYPFAVANSSEEIVALDISKKSLNRARLHSLLHGRFNIRFVEGDLIDGSVVDEKFGLIDAFGVLHHLDDPAAGLASLERRLADSGIIRIMLYSRYARRGEESIRRAFRLLKIKELTAVKRVLQRAKKGSKLHQFINSSYDASFNEGLADALLHPSVKTYRIDEILEMLENCGLSPMRFAGNGSMPDVNDEISRIRKLEKERLSTGNFVIYVGHKESCNKTSNILPRFIQLNRCLKGICTPLKFGKVSISSRFGGENPILDRGERNFLRRFVKPVDIESLSNEERIKVEIYRRSLFLLQYSA